MSTMDNSSASLTNEIIFSGLDQSRPSKWIFIILSIILSLSNIFASFGIIWFERFGSDNKRIFANKVVSSISWAVIVWYLFVQPFEIVLYLFRPFSKEFCFLSLILKNGLVLQFILFYDSIVVVRYFLIFWMRNPENFKDDFWARFLNLWTTFFW